MRKRWNFFLLKLALWRRISRDIFGARGFKVDIELHRDKLSDPTYVYYPGATTIVLVLNGRPTRATS